MFYVFDKVTSEPIFVGRAETLQGANKLMWQKCNSISCIVRANLLYASPALAALVHRANDGE
jgi:hypothetical protein